MLRLTEKTNLSSGKTKRQHVSVCNYCGDALHSFIDELEDGQQLQVLVCPTCYQTILYPSVPSEQVAVSQRVPLLEHPIYTS